MYIYTFIHLQEHQRYILKCTVKVYQHLTGTLLTNLITDIKFTENVSVMV